MFERRCHPQFPLGAVLALALLAACGDGEGPVGAPGGRGDIEIRYEAPRLQVAPTGSGDRFTLSVVLRRRIGEDETVPIGDALLRVLRESGAARATSETVRTDDQGFASVSVVPPERSDRSEFVLMLADDRGVFLPFDLVTAPVVPVGLEPGEVDPDLVLPSTGALLRFRFEPGEEAILVPYQVDDSRRGFAYRFFYAGTDPGAAGVAAFGLAPPKVPATRPEVVVSDRGHVVPGEIEDGELRPAAALASSIDIRSCRIDADRRAPLRYVGRHAALYVDAPADAHQERIDSIGRAFDERIFPTNTRLFGPTSDLDGNGVVLVVMSPDLRDAGGAYCDGVRTLGMEIFYAVWRPSLPIDRPLGTLAHEHQHLINAVHHARTTGAIGDERWLNEALSFAAEALNGYWSGPLMQIAKFLSWQNGGLTMLPFRFSENFSANYALLALYLGDRFGSDVYRRLGGSGLMGVENVEAATGERFETILRDWFLSVALSDRGWAEDPRWRYRTLDLHGMAEEIAGCACVPKPRLEGMNLESLWLDAPFDASRAMDGHDADYYRLVPPEGEGGTFDVFFDRFGRTTTRLAVARSPSR